MPSNLYPLRILCLVGDRAYSQERYSTSHPVLEGIFAKILPSRGHRVIWLLHSDVATKGQFGQKWLSSEVQILPSGGANRQGRIINAAWRTFLLQRTILDAVNRYAIDIIQIRNDWFAVLAAAHVRAQTGVPIVFQWSFPHHWIHRARIDDGLTNRHWLALARAHLDERFYRQALLKADHVLPISEWMQAELVKLGIPETKMTPLPLGFDSELDPKSIDRMTMRERHGLSDHPVLLYFGDMSRLRNLEFLLEATRIAIAQIPAMRLLMVGAGDRPDDLQHLMRVAENLGIRENVIFTGFVPRAEIPLYIATATVGTSPIRPIRLYELSSPTKLVEMMGLGCCVVANDIPEQKKLLGESQGGIVTGYVPSEFAAAIVYLLQNPADAQLMGQRGRTYILEHRSLQQLASIIEEVYASLVRPRMNSPQGSL